MLPIPLLQLSIRTISGTVATGYLPYASIPELATKEPGERDPAFLPEILGLSHFPKVHSDKKNGRITLSTKEFEDDMHASRPENLKTT